MATKIDVMRQIVIDLATIFPTLTAQQQIYLTPKIMTVTSMGPLELQVCEGAVEYGPQDGSCRDEDFIVQIGIFRKYRLDSGKRHAKALTDLKLSLFAQKAPVITLLNGSFLTGDLLDRPLIIRTESAITEPEQGQLLKILNFTAGLNVSML